MKDGYDDLPVRRAATHMASKDGEVYIPEFAKLIKNYYNIVKPFSHYEWVGDPKGEYQIDMGGTRSFAAEKITIKIETSYSVVDNERQLIIENFITIITQKL